MIMRRAVVLIAATVLAAVGTVAKGGAVAAAPGPESTAVAAAFTAAAGKYGVPQDLLAAVGYSYTRLEDHGGMPSASRGYGVMHLVDKAANDTLGEAASLTGTSPGLLRADTAANISGAAAVLSSYADQEGLTVAERADVNFWYGPVARYSGATDPTVARLAADTVYELLATGFAVPGAGIKAEGRNVAPQRGALASTPALDQGAGALSTDYGPAAWAAAHSSNYTVANRETDYPINYVVIHVTQGSYAGSISWYQNPASDVSAHYTIRSSDGHLTQSVREKDIAWHAGNWTINTQSIGIEHEGWVDNPVWFTDVMYRSSAALTRHLADRYGIPKDRAHIIAHSEVPGAGHTDPGIHWNWGYYMQLVTGGTGIIGSGTVGAPGTTLNVRSGPGTGYSVVGSLADGAAVSIYCQATGTTVTGTYGTTNIWNRIGTSRFISDAYTYTGYPGFIPGVPRC
jgi:hypothetical protein